MDKSFLFLVLIFLRVASSVTDYIVVGGGTAGCALAARLCTHLPHRTVVILERASPLNGSEHLLKKSPRLALDAQSSRLAEIIESDANSGLNGRTSFLVTGNSLGGASSINSGQWTLPPLAQVASWGFRGLNVGRAASLYARAESRTRPMQPPPSLRQDLADDWITAAQKVGLPVLQNPLTEKQKDGVYYNYLTATESGERNDACTAYLKPSLKYECKHNLRLIEGATVTKLLLSLPKRCRRSINKCIYGNCLCSKSHSQNLKRVRGIEYVLSTSPSIKRFLNARKQVVVSAGPIGSPKLLQLSGIGPPDVLGKAGISLSHALPVGKNVQSRSMGLLLSVYTRMRTVRDNIPTEVHSLAEREKFMSGQGGLLGKGPAGTIGRFSKDFYLLMTNTFPTTHISAGKPLILSICLGQPKSFGSISVTGKNPFAAPKLSLNYLGGNGEAARMAVCLQKMRDLHENLPKSLGAMEVRPGANKRITEAVARENAQSAYHAVGGCAVGSVVDADFRIKNFDGVRVVDSSVIPQMPRQAGVMASVYMLAELAADIIRGED